MNDFFTALAPVWSAFLTAFPVIAALFAAHVAAALLLIPARLAGIGADAAPWRYLHGVAGLIDSINSGIGKWVSWLTVAMVGMQFAIIVVSYVFSIGSIWYQESIIYMHASLFLLAAAYTLIEDGHVRVDVFFRSAGEKRKAATDLFGSVLLLIPMMVLILYVSYPYVSRSWSFFEASKETSGIQAVYLLKGLILVFAGLMCLQALSAIIRNAHRLAGGTEPEGHHPAPGQAL